MTWRSLKNIDGVLAKLPASSGIIAPLFIENLIENGLTRYNASVENSTLVVSGTKGARALNVISGSTANFFATNPATTSIMGVLADDQGQNFYFVKIYRNNGGVLELGTALPVTVTGAVLSNKYVNSQHLTPAGYKAYARRLANADVLSAILPTLECIYEINHRDAWANATTFENIWKLTGTATGKQFAFADYTASFATNDDVPSKINPFCGRLLLTSTAGTAIATAIVNLEGNTKGVVQLDLGLSNAGNALPANVTYNHFPGTINIYAYSQPEENSGVITETLIETRAIFPFVERFVIPFTSNNRLKIEVILTGNAALSFSRAVYFGDLKILKYPTVFAKNIISSTDKILVFGDSWTDPAGLGANFVPELSRLTQANFITQFNYTYPDNSTSAVKTALSGTTTGYCLDWLQLAIDANPGINKVLLHYFVNDNNCQAATAFNFTAPNKTTKNYNICTLAGVTPSRAAACNVWANNIREIITLCIKNGIQPIIMLPDAGGNRDHHAYMAYALTQQTTVKPMGTFATAADLALIGNPHNQRGKYAGKTVADPTPAGAAKAIYVATGPAPTDAWALVGTTTTITPT